MEKFKPIRKQFIYKDRVIYEWEQTLEDVNIFVTPPQGIKAKMIDCKITPTQLTLGIKGNPPFIQENFFSQVKVKDSFWTMGIYFFIRWSYTYYFTKNAKR
jgi:hypothetical protein